MSIRVTVSGPSRSPFRGFTWSGIASRWASTVGPVVEEALRREAPVGQGPGGGRLRDSIRYEKRSGAGSIQLAYTASVPYAGYVLNGTGPHEIRPRRARVLAFQQGGQQRFARVVHHPGTRPNPFPTRAVRPLLPLIQQRFAEIVTSSLRG